MVGEESKSGIVAFVEGGGSLREGVGIERPTQEIK